MNKHIFKPGELFYVNTLNYTYLNFGDSKEIRIFNNDIGMVIKRLKGHTIHDKFQRRYHVLIREKAGNIIEEYMKPLNSSTKE